MRAILAAAVLVCCMPLSAMTQRVRIETGTVSPPTGFTVHERRGTDSHPGTIVRADSSLVIHYDIGAMAGARAHPSHRKQYLWLAEHRVSGRLAYTGLTVREGRRWLVTTVLGDSRDAWTLPANFEADVRDERAGWSAGVVVRPEVANRGD